MSLAVGLWSAYFIAKTSLGDEGRFAAAHLIVNVIVNLIDSSSPTLDQVDDQVDDYVNDNDRVRDKLQHVVARLALTA